MGDHKKQGCRQNNDEKCNALVVDATYNTGNTHTFLGM
jgi:hypothetical protein